MLAKFINFVRFKLFSKTVSPANYRANAVDQALLKTLAKNRLPDLKQIKYIKRFLSLKEKLIVAGCLLLLLTSLGFLWRGFYLKNLQTAPDYGGEYTEGQVGAPQYINPLHASLSSVDAGLSRLVYSSLLTRGPDGHLSNDLAQSLEISPDGKAYTIKINEQAYWHNDEKVTADDVVFTFNTLQDPQFKSPLRSSFQGVVIEKLDDYTIRFNLPQSFAPFQELLTFGIMPKNLWQDVSPFGFALAELNLMPIGSGPFKFESLIKDKGGNIKNYTFTANNRYYGGRPYLDKITCRFFNEQGEAITALNNGQIDGLSYLDWLEKKTIATANSFNFHELALPQYSALFFNTEKELGEVSKVKFRQALSMALDKEALRQAVYNTEQPAILNGPILPNNSLYNPDAKNNFNQVEAFKILTDLGWKRGEPDETGQSWLVKNNQTLTTSITVPDSEELIAMAESTKKQWEALGIKTELIIIDKKSLTAEIIRPRDFSVLLYNVAVSHDPDAYPLWHSSQTGAGGFNLSNYKNSQADKLLTDARAENNPLKRQEYYKQLETLINNDYPAIFLFSQPYIYLQSKKLKGFDLQAINSPEDRFNSAVNWHLKEKRKINF